MLHVSNGHSATGLIERSGVPGRTLAWCDPLNDGPVPGNISDEELVRTRAEFLAGRPEETDEVAADLASWRQDVDDQSNYDELVLWFEHDLFDQLNLIQLLTHLGSRPSIKPVTMVSIDSFQGHANFKGLGELSPEDFPALFEARRPITPQQIALATRAWHAYRSADPLALEQLLESDTSALPFLAAAVRRHLEEFPAEAGGLSRSERRMMEMALERPADIHQAFARMHQGETAYFITDLSFFDLANALATAEPPLLIINLKHPKESEMPVGTLELTAQGRDVLRGLADRIRLCGIDRWLGGVHLEGRGPVWRWSARERRLMNC